jgi:hypothetical protein
VLLSIEQGDLKSNTKVYYLEGVTKGFDNGYDSSMFTAYDYKLAVFTQLVENNEGKNLGVQSLPKSDLDNTIVPIGLIAKANEEITFSAEALNLSSDVKVFLEDRLTNTFTRLDETNAEFKVTLTEAVNGAGRFYLHTTQSVLSVDDAVQLNSISIYKTSASTLRIAGLSQGEASVSLFNIFGKQVMNTSFKANGSKDISLPKLATGIYFVKVQTIKGEVSKKIILE